MQIAKLVVIGVGLVGGSCALALKARGAVGEVVGIGRSQPNLDVARRCAIVDRALGLADDWPGELADADLVLVATPLAQYDSLLPVIARGIGPRTLVTDAGSAKQQVVERARKAFGEALPRFVPAHPIAGSERSGAEAASATLYEGCAVIVTPIEQTDAAALARVEAMWERCGASVRRLDPASHDAIYAAVSHLPHLVAFAFIDALCERAGAAPLEFAGSGFRDFTRIAASSPEMWRDILLANRQAVAHELDAFRVALERFADALARGDGAALQALIERAASVRRAWGERCADAALRDET